MLSKRTLVWLTLIGTLVGCVRAKSIITEEKEDAQLIKAEKNLTVKAINLSEDMTLLASNDDEILLMIFEYLDSNQLGAAWFTWSSTFDADSMIQKASLPMHLDSSNQHLMVLLELDSDVSPTLLASAIQSKHEQLKDDFANDRYSKIKEALGDTDILGMTAAPTQGLLHDLEITFKGIHKGDRYEYRLKISGY